MVYTTKINDSVSIEWDVLVILIETGTYQYEVDPEFQTSKEWLEHLKEKTWYTAEISEGINIAFDLLKTVKTMIKNVK